MLNMEEFWGIFLSYSLILSSREFIAFIGKYTKA